MKDRLKYLHKILYMAVIALMAGACVSEEFAACGDGSSTYVSLVFDTRSTSFPSAEENSESGVASLRVFIYNRTGRLEFTQKYEAGNGFFECPVIEVTAGIKNIYVVVNEKAAGVDTGDLAAQLDNLSVLGSLNAASLEALIVRYTAFPKLSARGLLMAGRAALQTVEEGRTPGNPQKIVVDVVRNCARLDLNMQKAASSLEFAVVLKKVEFLQGCNRQALFEQEGAVANPAGAACTLSDTPYADTTGIAVTRKQISGIDSFQYIGTYYLPENLGNYTEENHGEATVLQLTYTVDGVCKTSRIDLNDLVTASKRYNLERNTKYELNCTVSTDIKITLDIKPWVTIPINGNIQPVAFLSAPGEVLMNWWNLGESYTTEFSFAADADVELLGYYVNDTKVTALPSWIQITEPTLPADTGTFVLTYTPTNGVHDDVVIRLKRGNIVKYIPVIYDHGYIPNEFLQKAGWTENLPANGIHLAQSGNKLPGEDAGKDSLYLWSNEKIKNVQLIEPTLKDFYKLYAPPDRYCAFNLECSSFLNAANPSFGNGPANTELIKSLDTLMSKALAGLDAEWYVPSVGEMAAIVQYQDYLGRSYEFCEKQSDYYRTSSLCNTPARETFEMNYVGYNPGGFYSIYASNSVPAYVRVVRNMN